MRQIKFILLSVLLVLSGCWSSQEIDDTALVHGVGIDRLDDNKINMSVEIIKPAGQGNAQRTDGQQNDGNDGQYILLENKADSLFEGARNLIRYAKRRLDFGHTRLWVISEKLAKDDFVQQLDSIRRDQMLRLNSYLFVTEKNPSDILHTPTLYENLTALEIVSALDQTKFFAEYSPVRLREFYTKIEGPLPNAFIPMITLENVGKQTITSLKGTAIIKDYQMVGKLDIEDSIGLNWLLDRVRGGSIVVSPYEDEKVSLEITKAKTKSDVRLDGELLLVEIETKIEGTLADNMTTHKINEQFFREIEKEVSQNIENKMRSTFETLQQLQADVTQAGINTHRKYPKEWLKIRTEWDDIFTNADLSVDVVTTITHPGLINESVKPYMQKPNNNPYQFRQKE